MKVEEVGMCRGFRLTMELILGFICGEGIRGILKLMLLLTPLMRLPPLSNFRVLSLSIVEVDLNQKANLMVESQSCIIFLNTPLIMPFVEILSARIEKCQ